MCDQFSALRNIEFASYADDNTLYVIGRNARGYRKFRTCIKWFNGMVFKQLDES